MPGSLAGDKRQTLYAQACASTAHLSDLIDRGNPPALSYRLVSGGRYSRFMRSSSACASGSLGHLIHLTFIVQ